MNYRIPRQQYPSRFEANWHDPAWDNISAERLHNYMGEYPDHFPNTQVKLSYSAEFIHIIFRVEDRYVKAVSKKHQGDIWKDSCVEFFFTPGSDDFRMDYFNIEMNCGGTMLFHFQPGQDNRRIEIPETECRKIRCAHSLPHIIDQEITDPITWTVEYQIPFSLLEPYCLLTQPAPGVRWKANFYKCADNSSRPHWLTWAPVSHPKPNFHLPEFFGTLEFL